MSLRIHIILFLVILSVNTQGQSIFHNRMIHQTNAFSVVDTHFTKDSSNSRPWQLNKFSGLSIGYGNFNGIGATVLSAPIGLQLTRKLNNNLYAFGNISTAPAFINLTHSFISTDIQKIQQNNKHINPNAMNMYSRAELGLMYVNDQKTFSISASIGVEKSSNPVFNNNQLHVIRPNTVVYPKK